MTMQIIPVQIQIVVSMFYSMRGVLLTGYVFKPRKNVGGLGLGIPMVGQAFWARPATLRLRFHQGAIVSLTKVRNGESYPGSISEAGLTQKLFQHNRPPF
jgi:hypothetical protein